MRARGLVFVLWGAIPFGCSLLIETDELTNEGAPSSTGGSVQSDARPDVSSHPDSSGTGGAKDAGKDAPLADAAGEADAPVLGFCEGLSPAPTLCSDFDTGAFPAGWDTHTEWGKCNGSIDGVDFTSSPRSFFASTLALTATTDQCSTCLVKDFPKPETSLRIEFDVFFGALDAPDWIHLVTIDTSTPQGSDTILFRVRQGEFLVSETAKPKEAGYLYAGHGVPATPTVGQWTHILWTIDLSGSTGAFSNVNVDGQIGGDKLYLKGYVAAPHIKVGIAFAQGPSGPWEVRVDDLVVDVK